MNYTELSAAIGSWGTRYYGQEQTDQFIALAQSQIDTELGPDYRREVTATLTTDSSGEVALPIGFIGMRSLVRDVPGSAPLAPIGWRDLTSLNPFTEAGIPSNYAISGSVIKVGPIAEDDFIATYAAQLTAPSTGAPTNWLLTLAPDVYLFLCNAAQRAFEEEWEASTGFEAKGLTRLNKVVGQSVVAQYAAAEMVLDTITP